MQVLTMVSRGDDVAHGFTQHVFFARPTNLVADGQASGIFGDMMVEEGHSPLNRMRHLHAVAS